MRYAALNQDTLFLARYGDFLPAHFLAPGAQVGQSRYSDEQLYALALYLYSLKPPPNPNKFDAAAARGQKVFEREACARNTFRRGLPANRARPCPIAPVPHDNCGAYAIGAPFSTFCARGCHRLGWMSWALVKS